MSHTHIVTLTVTLNSQYLYSLTSQYLYSQYLYSLTSQYLYSQYLSITPHSILTLGLGLGAWKRDLDAKVLTVVEHQKSSTAARKQLVDATRDFRRTSPGDERVAALLKAYQAEIDAAGRRCKFAEVAFVDAYKRIVALPDPVPLLEGAILSAKRLEDQLRSTSANVNTLSTVNTVNTADTVNTTDNTTTNAELEARLRERESALEEAFRAKLESLNDAQREAQLQIAGAKEQAAALRDAFARDKQALQESLHKQSE